MIKKILIIWSLLLLPGLAAERDDHSIEMEEISSPQRHEVGSVNHSRRVTEDDNDTLIQSCACEKHYHECTSVCWSVSANWWNLLGFTSGQAATILQVLSTIGTDNPETFSEDTLTNFLIAGAILTQSSAAFHAFQLYAKQTALSRKEMAERIQIVQHRMAAHHMLAQGTRLTTSIEPMPQEPNTCLRWYNTVSGGFWRIAGGWFSSLGFLSSQTAVILQFLSPLAATYPDNFHENAATNFLIGSAVLTQLSTFFHAFEAYAYKTASERSYVVRRQDSEEAV